MKLFENKKQVGIVVLFIILLIYSLIKYNYSKTPVFNDEYMHEIFVEEDSDSNDIKSNTQIEVKEKTIVVEIKGEVNKPDVYILNQGSIVKDLIDMAGGLTDEANIDNINRAKELQNHELVIISNTNSIDEETIEGNVKSAINNDGKVNINLATIEELMTIPGIGEVKANSIIEYRESNGGFKNLDELMNIDGIGEKTLSKISEKITL